MPDDERGWKDGEWDASTPEEPSEPEIFTLHREDVDEASGHATPESESADGHDADAPSDDDAGEEAVSDELDDVFDDDLDAEDDTGTAGSWEAPAFVEPDGIDSLFSGAIASQVAEQQRISELLTELLDRVDALASSGTATGPGGNDDLAGRIAAIDGRFSVLEQRLETLGERLARDLSAAQERASETLRSVQDGGGSALADRIDLLEARIEGLAGRLDESRDQARSQVDEVLAAVRAAPVASLPEEQIESLRSALAGVSMIEASPDGASAEATERMDQLIALQHRLSEAIEEVRGDVASQYGAQSAAVLGELDERVAGIEGALGDLTSAMLSANERIQLDLTALRGQQPTPDGASEGVVDMIGELAARIEAAVEASEHGSSDVRRRMDALAAELDSIIAGQASDVRAAVQREMAEQRAAFLDTIASAALDSDHAGEAVAQLRGTVAALADDVAEAVAGQTMGVTRADIEGFEHLLEEMAGVRSDNATLTSIQERLLEQRQAIEMLSDALLEVSGALSRTPDVTADAVSAAHSAAVADVEGIADEIRTALAESRDEMATTLQRLIAGAGTIDQRAEEAVGRIVETLAAEGKEGRRQLRSGSVQLAEAIERVRSLEVALLDRMIQREELMASERSMIAAELVAVLSEVLPKRMRKRLADRLVENAVPMPEPPPRLTPAPDRPLDSEELTPSRPARRSAPGPERLPSQRRPDPGAASGEPTELAQAAAEAPTEQGMESTIPPGVRASTAPRRSGHRPSPPSAPGTAKPKRPARKGGRRAIEEAREALGEIKGVGPARQDMLLEAFGDLQGVAEADVKDLAALPGITDELARAIKRKADKVVS